MNKLSQFRQCIALLALAMFATGCATTGRVKVSEPNETSAIDLSEVAQTDSSSDVTYPLLRHAFALRSTHPEHAQSLLDSVAVLLTERFADSLAQNTAQIHRTTGVVRATLECYYAILPQTTALQPNSPIAQLLNTLPQSIAQDLSNHPYYASLYIRKLAGQADVPIDYTSEVAYYVLYFSTEGRDFFARWLSRSTAYLPMIQAEFQKRGLPKDLAYKAMIESGFYPFAESRVRAVGMWQFMRPTATLYGLKNNSWIDERREPEKATKSAAAYLQKLYKDFGDWRLVVAAYNCGEGRLERAMRDAKTRNFWQIYTLPLETRNHVPKFMAAIIIAKDPAWFGFEDVAYQPPLVYDTVTVSDPVSLKVAAQCVGTTYAWMQQLNPELHRGYTPPTSARTPYSLRVPVGSAEKFKTNYAQIPASQKIQLVDYVVKPGDTLSGIAHRLGVRTKALMDANKIDDPKKVRAGRKLTIPVHPDWRPTLAHSDTPKRGTPITSTKKTTYKVQSGDTLWDIAKQTGVTVSQLQTWNNLKKSQPIRPGDQLVYQTTQVKQTQTTFYTVQRGDTLWDIARAFQTSVEDLKTWNRIQKPANLRPGDRIRVRPISANKIAE